MIGTIPAPPSAYTGRRSGGFRPNSEFGVIVLVLVVLVLDLWDFGAEKRARSVGNYFVPPL